MIRNICTVIVSALMLTATPTPTIAGTFWTSPSDYINLNKQINSNNYSSTNKYAIEDGVNIYSEASDSSKVLDQSLKNTEFEVVEERNNWSLITTQDGYAFIHTDKLSDTEIKDEPKWESLGTFKLTYYDAHPCCATGNGVTASGRKATVGRTIAMSKKYAPLGAHVMINGHEYVVDDRGVTGRTVDILVNTHSEARKLGVKHAEVFILKE